MTSPQFPFLEELADTGHNLGFGAERLCMALQRLDNADEVAGVLSGLLRGKAANSARTAQSYGQAARMLIEWCAHRREGARLDPLRLDHSQAERFQQWLREHVPDGRDTPYAPATRRHCESALRQLGKRAVRDVGGTNPWRDLDLTKAPRGHVVHRPPLNSEQITRLADAADRDRLLNLIPRTVEEPAPDRVSPQGRCLIGLMARVLRRADDVCAINTTDLTAVVTPGTGGQDWYYVLTAREKGSRWDRTPIPRSLSANLAAWMQGHRAQLAAWHGGLGDSRGDPLFVHPRLGRRLSRYALGRIVTESCDLSGLTGELRECLSPHDLRAGGITHMLTSGYALEDVQRTSHHADIRTIERYRNDARPDGTAPQMRMEDAFPVWNASRVVPPLDRPRNAKPPVHDGCRCVPPWQVLYAPALYQGEWITVVCEQSSTPIPPKAAGLDPYCSVCQVPYTGPVMVHGRVKTTTDDVLTGWLSERDNPAPATASSLPAAETEPGAVEWDLPDDDHGAGAAGVAS